MDGNGNSRSPLAESDLGGVLPCAAHRRQGPKRPSPSRIRRKERRAADPAVQQRAAQHQAHAAANETGEVLASPEKERASFAFTPLGTSPVKEDVREEVEAEGEEEVEKRPRLQVPEDYED